jgi:hypothetical protein
MPPRDSATAEQKKQFEEDALAARKKAMAATRPTENRMYYADVQTALYLQDDIRIRRNLSVTPGVRVEMQNHIKGVVAGPRVGATWAPFKDGKTTLRASWGLFYDWLPTNTYEQAIRINGLQQREINLANPTYPDTPLDVAGATPADRYFLDPDLEHPGIPASAGELITHFHSAIASTPPIATLEERRCSAG